MEILKTEMLRIGEEWGHAVKTEDAGKNIAGLSVQYTGGISDTDGALSGRLFFADL
jgi:hypothetical protein